MKQEENGTKESLIESLSAITLPTINGSRSNWWEKVHVYEDANRRVQTQVLRDGNKIIIETWLSVYKKWLSDTESWVPIDKVKTSAKSGGGQLPLAHVRKIRRIWGRYETE